MAVGVKITHKFKSQKADSNDASLIKPSNWNDDHAIVLPGKTIIGNSSVDEGAAVPLTLGNGLSLSGNTLVGGYPGALVFMAGTVAPPGTLKANGALVSRTAYARLFAYIGTTHGAGDGATTFALPDYRAEFIRGLDDGRGVDTGRSISSAQDSQNLAHTHEGATAEAGAHTHTASSETAGSHTHEYEISQSLDESFQSGDYIGQGQNRQQRRGNGKIYANGAHIHVVKVESSGAHTHTVTVTSSGGTEARPRNRAALICIQY